MASLADIFRRHTSDQINYLQYAIYFPPQDSPGQTERALQQKRSAILDALRPWATDHLWQKDDFQLTIVNSHQRDPAHPFLWGVARFGDCLNDEWLLIAMLYRVTELFNDAIVSLHDNDGEILLIEAADHLPPWLDPSNSDNRVYVYRGQLHIIPMPSTPADLFAMQPSAHGKQPLRRADALDMLWHRRASTVASDDIQRALAVRLDGFPDKAKLERHHAWTVLFNSQATYLFLSFPPLLCWAIDAFYLRDPVSLKACGSMQRFPLDQPVTVLLPWTRTTFAQTVHQHFFPPPVFDKVLPRRHSPTYDSAQLGMKLLCGLEMLLFNASRATPAPSKTTSDQLDDTVLLDRPPTTIPDGLTILQWVDRLLEDYTPAKLNQLLNRQTQSVEHEDDTAWMDMVPDELEAILAQHGSKPADEQMPVDLNDMMSKFEHFLVHSQSDVDGVTLPGQQSDDDEQGSDGLASDDMDDMDDMDDSDLPVSFNVHKFMELLNLDQDHLAGDDIDPMAQLMEQMDQEMATHEKLAASFERQQGLEETAGKEREEDETTPVDIQLNLVKNVLESFKGQQGLPGPAGNLLRQFNIALPRDESQGDEPI
ncbi:SGT1-domain-containing protein [Hesseltinella vesiculosa]|uniref:SGT1-domain-containing protein n=1 Tax=Hesseltinella vesiculosa TaxID=101127 RepID=A0A1X2G4Z8_9FUNG|nr:SGT1-domain-containing protein [Hesseltinella vesiculosa]